MFECVRLHGAMVARPTPDRKVGGSTPPGVTVMCVVHILYKSMPMNWYSFLFLIILCFAEIPKKIASLYFV